MDTLSLIGYSLNACYATTVKVILLTFMFKVTEQNKNVNQQLTKIKKETQPGRPEIADDIRERRRGRLQNAGTS